LFVTVIPHCSIDLAYGNIRPAAWAVSDTFPDTFHGGKGVPLDIPE
jgi:hypothetical protein